MCGVAGVWAPAGAGPEHAELVGAMLRTLRLRGPDGFSVHVAGRAVMGHARLAIIDLATGDQPLTNETGDVQCVFNGEIYNYRELRAGLEARGHVFRSQSDTETIPHLYEEKGDACLDDLRGMFALQVHDAKRGRLLIARDRLGKKPLYWARTSFGFAYASEPRALLVVPGIDRSVDPEAVAHLLTWQYVPAPWSIYRGIRKLPAATKLVLDADGRAELSEFWNDLPVDGPRLSSDEALARVEAALDEACALRLRSDVPVGAFLSGGIDSGLVATVAARRLGTPLRAVHVSFGGPEDETALARLSAKAAGIVLTERTLSMDVAATSEAVFDHLDEPHGDSSCVPTWLVCKAAREEVTVALSGDGGDETFAGYPALYGHNLFLDGIRRVLPRAFRAAVFGGLASVWPRDARLPRPLRLANVLASAARDAFEGWAVDRTVWRPSSWRPALRGPYAEALKGFDPYAWPRALWKKLPAFATPLDRLLYLDRRTYLAEGVIAKVDRMSMAHSIEVRSPLLDHEIVGLSLRVADRDKFDGGVGKRLLRRLAAKTLPPEVVGAKKSGFAPPLAGWLRGPLRALVAERLLRGPTLVGEMFDPAAVRDLWESHQSGARNRARELWTLFALESWARRWR